MDAELDVDQVRNGIETEGLAYYLEHYAKTDFEGTKLEPLLNTYLEALHKLEDALEDVGVSVDG